MNYIEIIGALTGLLFLYFEYKENYLLWPVGIISAGFYIVVFFDAKFYADMSLQLYFFVVSIYGWYYWWKVERKKNSNKTEEGNMPILKSSARELILFSFITLVLSTIIYFILKKYTDSPVPLGDSFVTALSIVATWMLTRKYLEQWHFWIIANAVSVYLFLQKQLYPTAIFYLVLTIISVAGFWKWNNHYKIQNND
jgi:nicotinamide mononucleotide transporter